MSSSDPSACATATPASVPDSARANIMSTRENATAIPSLLRGRVRLPRDRDLRTYLQECLLPDALDVHQLFDLLEWPLGFPILHDTGRHLRADAGQHLELHGRCGIEIDHG